MGPGPGPRTFRPFGPWGRDPGPGRLGPLGPYTSPGNLTLVFFWPPCPHFNVGKGLGNGRFFLKVQVWIPPAGCAGWARNPNRPQVTPFFHQLGRRGTILDISNGVRRRISLRISPGGSRPLNLNFFGAVFQPKSQFSVGKKDLRRPRTGGTWVKSLCGHIGNMTHPCVAISGI